MKKIVLLMTLLCLFFKMNGQSYDAYNDAYTIDNDVVKEQIQSMVVDYQYQLFKLANGSNLQSVRNTARDVAKALFMKKGGYYTYQMNNQTISDKCIMETVNKYKPAIKYKKLVRNYLDVLAQQPYKIEITGTKEIVVDNPKKISDTQLQTTAYIGQKFVKYSDNKIRYIDITYKKIVVFIDIYIVDNKYEYVIRLEDCEVQSVAEDGTIPESLQYD